MEARDALMTEHGFISRMVALIKETSIQIEKEKKTDPARIEVIVDFIRTYADRTHHGKEEDIMFRDLRNRNLGGEDQQMMNILMAEHILGRQLNGNLEEANRNYRTGSVDALNEVMSALRSLADLYPKHIHKEDDIFFPAARTYVSDEEDQSMLEEFWEFDRKMIHEKYRQVLQRLEHTRTSQEITAKN